MHPAAAIVPKSLLPVGAWPMLHWALDEALAAEVGGVVLIVGPEQGLIREYVETAVRQGEGDAPGQALHPGLGVVVQHAAGIGEPLGRQEVATRPRRETAAAVLDPAAQGLLAVAHDHGDAGAADQIDRRLRVGAIRDQVAGAEHAPGRYPTPPGLGQESPGRLQIAVGTAENEDRLVESSEIQDIHHRATGSYRSAPKLRNTQSSLR